MQKPLLMGILNVTPDSFFDGGNFFNIEAALNQANFMIASGVDIIDIGGESTRPGSLGISCEEELKRVAPIIQEIKHLPVKFSIDTSKPEVAEFALKHGASMLNDVTGFSHPKMRSLAADYDVQVCVMHMRSTPQTMQNNTLYPEGVVAHIRNWFQKSADKLLEENVKPENIILDPGIGFGKSVKDNLELIKSIPSFKELGYKILIGLSRKSFMKKILKKNPIDLLPATIAMNTIALVGGADIIRVHDISEHRDLIDVFSFPG
ncbi:MAG: dihydropteroate synthase [Chlamydiae bacterium CG10_big_fil_rev_8_21_14_0_10_35_9]|nr:MAG: dihydropteroate synthase [Chlamydiae bacterium CG10_big_fil_rev_8_21_14_0_10_35_9]